MRKIDRTNAIFAAVVFLGSFIVYALTVQRSFSFWDCGEFIASAYILGVPHPPGTPLYVLLGRIFAIIPFVEDIAYRINYLSVISSSVTAVMSYLLTVKLVGYFFGDEKSLPLNRWIAYMGGLAGGFFVAFSQTNWGNSVETEVYGASLALMTVILYLTLRYRETIGTPRANKLMILAFFIAAAGISVHMTVYLVVPVCAIFFVLKKEATPRDWAIMCGFGLFELILIFLFANGRGGASAFYLTTALIGAIVLLLLYRKINWSIVIAVGCLSTVMVAFSIFIKVVLLGLALFALMSRRTWGVYAAIIFLIAELYKFTSLFSSSVPYFVLACIGIIALVYFIQWVLDRIELQFQWRHAMLLLLIGVIGLSIHTYIPIRSALDPRIDENNPARSYDTFISYLDRKQYGQTSMTTRMFDRRGSWSNQLGRHPHMGYWSYFEEQYSSGGWSFVPFFLLGLVGMYVAIRKRLEMGLPFFTLFIFCSIGLVLYMNFADGTMYDPRTQDAYLEVRNRDYFFTPAFVFFGIAMGMGVSAVMNWLRGVSLPSGNGSKNALVYASSVLVLLPTISLAVNYHINDRSDNYLPLIYAKNFLDTCEPDAIMFTSGDNDTFPIWCLQEVYNYRKDVRIVCLSLLNTDWYTAQMKNQYDVPMSLTDSQILWYPYEYRPGLWASRPHEKFLDRPRRAQAYMQAYMFGDQYVRVQDMMMDDIVIENAWRYPIYFSGPPYGTSPLDLRGHSTTVGYLGHLNRERPENPVDIEASYDLFMNTYSFQGMETADVFRDDNATGLFQGNGARAAQLFDALIAQGDTVRAMDVINKLTKEYPEYLQGFMVLSEYYDRQGDSTKATEVLESFHSIIQEFIKKDPHNQYYVQDLGMVKNELGRRYNDAEMLDEAVELTREGFEINANNILAFRKLAVVLIQQGRTQELTAVARMAAQYKQNADDPYVRQALGMR